jgi:mRNA interferase HigB
MVIISKRVINEFIAHNPKSSDPLLRWYIMAKEGDWTSYSELKKQFSSTDAVGNYLCVFNVGGNKYRLIARVFFKTRTIYIRFIGSHAQYDKVKLSDL